MYNRTINRNSRKIVPLFNTVKVVRRFDLDAVKPLLDNCKHHMENNHYYVFDAFGVNGLFVWKETKEGHDYWSNLCYRKM